MTERRRPVIAKGKYEYWLTNDGLLFLEGWAREGLTDEQIASKMGISSSTFYAWKNVHSEISEAIKKGKAPVDMEVENALLKRARGYSYDETTVEYGLSETEVDENGNPKKYIKNVKVVKKEVLPDVGAIAFWLKNRRPDRWRDRREEAMGVTDERPVIIDARPGKRGVHAK